MYRNGVHALQHSSVPGLPVGDTIQVARLVCILGIVYAHAWTGLTATNINALPLSYHTGVYWLLKEALGRGAVPLLTIISGWLVERSVKKRSYRAFAFHKARTLILPMLVWNILAVLVFTIFALVTGKSLRFEASLSGWSNEILHLTKAGALNVQNSFLRDMFICMLAAPWIVRLSNHGIILLCFALVSWILLDPGPMHILLRPEILLFFLLGIIIRRCNLLSVLTGLSKGPYILLLLCILTLRVSYQLSLDVFPQLSTLSHTALGLGFRLLVSLCFWWAACVITRSDVSGFILRLAPLSFLIFCSHMLVLALLGPAVGLVMGKMGEGLWLMFFIAQPLIVLAGALAIKLILPNRWPEVAKILTGGRVELQPLGQGKTHREM